LVFLTISQDMACPFLRVTILHTYIIHYRILFYLPSMVLFSKPTLFFTFHGFC